MNIIIDNPQLHTFDKPDFGTVRATLVEDSAFVCRSDLAKSILGPQDKQTSYRVFHNDTAICEYVNVKLGKGNPTIFLKAQDIVTNLDKAAGKGKSAKSSERRTVIKQWLLDEIIPTMESITCKSVMTVTVIEPPNQIAPAVISADNVSVVPTGMINDVRAYIDENGTAWINAEDAARGLGFVKTEIKDGKEYITIRWARINDYLNKFGFRPQMGEIGADDFIPENIFYRLAMKANNDAAERFQAYIADEVFPALRKTGFYAVGGKDPIDQIINNPDAFLRILQAHSETRKQNKELQETVAIMAPKAQVYDEICDTKNLIEFREGCGILRTTYGVRKTENEIRDFLVEIKWLCKEPKTQTTFRYRVSEPARDKKLMASKTEPGYDGKSKVLNCFTPKGLIELARILIDREKRKKMGALFDE